MAATSGKRKAEEELEDSQPVAKKPLIASQCVDRTKYLDVLHRHPKDARVYFEDEPHLYHVDWKGDGVFTHGDTCSVTKLIHHFFPVFDADECIATMQNRESWVRSKYYPKTADEIKAQWKELGRQACMIGSSMHQYIDQYYNKEPEAATPPAILAVELQHFEKLREEIHGKSNENRLVPYRSEFFMFSDDKSRIPGAADMLFVNDAVMKTKWDIVKNFNGSKPDTLHVVMYDWKRCKEIRKFDFNRQTGYGPCKQIPNANYFHYSLQLSLYKYILENYYSDFVYEDVTYKKIQVDLMFICVLHPNKKTFQRHRAAYYGEEIEQIVRMREQNLANIREGKPEIYPFNHAAEPAEAYDFGAD